MARGRFISATLGGSRKFARLANNTHRMIYMLLIPSVDAYGRIDADPVTLCGRVLTRLGIAPDDANAALADMHQVGLIHLYQVGEDQFAEIVGFHEHNDIDLSREAQATIPDARGVMPPEKPPRGTRKAEADPRVWSGEYVAANAHPQAEQGGTAPAATAPAPPRAAPALARGGHVPHSGDQRQSNPSASRVEVEVEVEDEVEVKALKPLSADADAADPPSPVKKSKKRTIPTDQDFVDTWNEHRGMLPRVLVAKGRKKFFDRLRRELGDDALDLFRDAVKQVAQEPYYLEKGYGIGHLLSGDNGKVLKWAEKWRDSGGMSDSDRKLATTASKVAKAIGGMS